MQLLAIISEHDFYDFPETPSRYQSIDAAHFLSHTRLITRIDYEVGITSE